MDSKELKEIVAVFELSSANRMELDTEGLHLKLERDPSPAAVPLAGPIQQAQETTQILGSEKKTVDAPLVGVFWQAEKPGEKPFVTVGSTVKTGQTLCIIEAMKTMNEIRAEEDGVITAILAENGQLVEFGQPLFALEAGA